MKKIYKKLITIVTILMVFALPLLANAQTQIEYEVTSQLMESRNISVDLPFTPKVVSEALDKKSNKKNQMKYKATHKLIGKKVENGKTIYFVESDIDVPLKVKRKENKNIVQRVFTNLAYASDPSPSGYFKVSTLSRQ